jgi:type VI protein secretion system component VasK
MPHEQLWQLAKHADWRQMPVEYAMLAIGAFVVAVILRRSMRNSKRIQTIENQLSKMQNQLSKMQNEIAALLQIQTALITSRSLPATPAPPEDPESAKSPG